MAKGKSVLTTGDVARICNVAPRTVSKWFDRGQLKGYRIPGSKDRRIPVSELMRFMKAHNMPCTQLAGGKIRVLVVDSSRQAANSILETISTKTNYQVDIACSNFEVGALAEKLSPHVLLINLLAEGIDAAEICRAINANDELQTVKILAIAEHLSESEYAALLQKGFDGCIADVADASEIVRKIEEATAIIY